MALQHFHSHMRNHRGTFCLRVELEAASSMIFVDFRGQFSKDVQEIIFDFWIEPDFARPKFVSEAELAE